MWGMHGTLKGRDREVLAMITNPLCFKINTDGSPAHPLYLKSSTTLIPYQ